MGGSFSLSWSGCTISYLSLAGPERNMRTPLTPHSSESEGFAQSLRSFTGSLSARCGGPCKNPSLSVGFAALRAPHPFPLAAWALANYLKLTALRESLSLRDLGRWPTSLPRLRRGVAKEKENQLSSELDADFLFLLRRGRDSNPRSLSAQQFSRLP